MFEHPDHLGRFLRAYDGTAPVAVFTLWAPLEVLRRREASRAGRAPLGDRVAACHAAMEPHLAGLGEIVLADRPAAEIAALLDGRARAAAARAAAGV